MRVTQTSACEGCIKPGGKITGHISVEIFHLSFVRRWRSRGGSDDTDVRTGVMTEEDRLEDRYQMTNEKCQMRYEKWAWVSGND